ncbi:MATE family efflux transporter [Leucothrix sargassi]|nr:MATE family efflux transporter [Leucothrix sargassi]
MQQGQFPSTPSQWHWKVLSLAWPIILSSLSVPLVGMVDTAVVGQLDDPKYMGAVAVGAIIFSSVFWVFGFLRMGTTGFVSQAYGANNRLEVSYSLLRALSVAVALGVLLILLQTPVASLALYFMNAGDTVTPLVDEYYSIRIYSAPATFINYCVLGALIGMQRMRLALAVQLVLNSCNLVLDILFVSYLGWDSSGVALASVISEYTAALLGLFLLRSYLRIDLTQLKSTCASLYETSALRAMFVVNGNLFLRTLFLTSAFFYFTSQGAQFGVAILAANAILINLFQTMSYGLDGFAHAAEALAGGAYGAKNRPAFVQSVKSSSLWAGVMALGLVLLYAVAGDWIVSLMTVNEEVIVLANAYLPWLIFAPIITVWSYQLDGVFIGATETRVMRNTVAISLALYIVVSLYLIPTLGNHGLWLSLMIFMLARGVTLAFAYPKLLRNHTWKAL